MGRSLRAIAGLLEDNGNVKEAEATYRKAIGRLVALGPEIAKVTGARALLAKCRSVLSFSATTDAMMKPRRSIN